MAAIKGNLVVIKRGGATTSGTYTTVAGMRTKTTSINNNPIDVTTDDDVSAGTTFRSYITGVNEMSISGDGIATSVADFNALMALARSGDESYYKVLFTGYGTITGPMRISSFDPGASYDDTFTFSVSLASSGAWSYSSTATT